MTPYKNIAVFKEQCRAFVRSTQGATSIEYAIIGSLVSVFIIGAVMALGDNVGATFNSISEAVSGAMQRQP